VNAAVPVWSAAVRAAHWALAGCIGACLWLHEGGAAHERLGYAAAALAAARCAVGLRPRALRLRFAAFVRGPRATWAYARAMLARREPRYLGHNPLGAWMIVALLACALAAGLSGALYATDRFWGDETVYALHRGAGWALALLVPLHVGGVALTSWLQRENLLRAMIDGRKRPAAPGDIDVS
jgi:cytochrome b